MATPLNLPRITPPHMRFDILTPGLPETMYAGMLIAYRVRPLLGIPMVWLTEISQIREREYFVDEQRQGPYKLWHHQHLLIPSDTGVVMKDIVTYIPPLGPLGTLANALIIRNQLRQIFDYRHARIEAIFGKG